MSSNISFEIDANFRKTRQLLMQMPVSAGISHSEFGLMNVIYDHITPDGITVSRIAEIMDISPPAVSRTLKALDEKGFIERKINALNRRSTIVVLTEKGERILNSAQKNMLSMMNFVKQKMGEERVSEFNILFSNVLEYMAEYIINQKEESDDKNT